MNWNIFKRRGARDAETQRKAAFVATENVLRRQVEIEREQKLEAQAGLSEREQMIEALRAQLSTLNAQLKAADVLTRLEVMPVLKAELLEALRGVTPSTEWWRAVHSLIKDQEKLNVAALCVASDQGELVHFNRGRVSALQDLRDALLQHAAEAQEKAEN